MYLHFVNNVALRGHGEHHVEEIFGITQIVSRIYNGLAYEIIFPDKW